MAEKYFGECKTVEEIMELAHEVDSVVDDEVGDCKGIDASGRITVKNFALHTQQLTAQRAQLAALGLIEKRLGEVVSVLNKTYDFR